MNPLKIIYLLTAIVSLLIPTSTLAAGKHALLIGIQDYNYSKSIPSLKGPVNDIELTKHVLRERFGFQHRDFIIIKDKQATHTGIERAFKKLNRRVKRNDFVYIFYSGHGSQTADLNGDEYSGKDQTWVSYGARTNRWRKHKDNYDVLDDEINTWLAKLYAKTNQIVFVSDSCHSATVGRAVKQGTALVRAIKEDKRPHLFGKRRYQWRTLRSIIRIGAARDDESAIDFPIKDGKYKKYYGLFNWYWVQNLHRAQAGDTWNDVFKRTYAQVARVRGIVQHPQFEGNRQLQILDNGFTALPSTIPIHAIRVAHKNWVGIEAGSLAGVTKGSVYRLYRRTKKYKSRKARLIITKVTPYASYGRPKPIDTFRLGDLVVEENHAYNLKPTKLYLEAHYTKDVPLLKSIKTAVQTLSAYQLTDDQNNTHLRLYLLRPKREKGQLIYASREHALPKSAPNLTPELWVVTPEQRLFQKHLKLKFHNQKQGVKSLQNKLKKLARVRELKALQSHPSSNLPIALQTYIWTPVKSKQKIDQNCRILSNESFYCKSKPYSLKELENYTFTKGQILSFVLSNQSKKDYYYYLINITPDAAIRTIFPTSWEPIEFARINQGEIRQLPTGLELNQIGEETLKIITTNKPIDVLLFEQQPIRGRLRGRGLNPLEQLLAKAVHGQRSQTLIKSDEWASGQVTFQIKAIN